jgi:hypothetical protein
MLKKFFILSALGLTVVACNNQQPANGSDQQKEAQTFGAAVNAEGAISYDDLVTQMVGKDSMPAKVTAKVGEVCQAKGCWMTLLSAKGDAPEMRVTFKDYGFFVPKDLGGKEVVIEGFAYMETTSVEDLRHYAEDAGKSKEEIEAIKEPKRELAFEATGVVIKK